MKKILIFLLVVFTSCSFKDEKVRYKKRVVAAKEKSILGGSTVYTIAFKNGESDTFPFGLYTKYEVGDTVCSEQSVYGSWAVPCERCK